MPLWVKIYVIVYLLFVVSNLGYLLYTQSKPWMILYDFGSGFYLAFLMVGYWNVKLKALLDPIHIPFFIAIIAFEFYMTTWGKLDEMGIKLPDISEKDAEIAKVFSLLFSAPAYICGGLLCLDIATK
jgi:hypothetical protein